MSEDRSDSARFENATYEAAREVLTIFRKNGYKLPDISDETVLIDKIADALEPAMAGLFPDPEEPDGLTLR